MKIGLISFDGAMRSNLAVGPPLDMVILPRDGLSVQEQRIEADDPYFSELGRLWAEAMRASIKAMPAPKWLVHKTALSA